MSDSNSTWQPGAFYRDGSSDNGLLLVQNYNMQQKFNLLRVNAKNQYLSDAFLAEQGLTGGKRFFFGAVSGKLINKYLPEAGDGIETYADLLEAASDSNNPNQDLYIQAAQNYEDKLSTGEISSVDGLQSIDNAITYTAIDTDLNRLSKPTAQTYDILKVVSGRLGLGSDADARSLFFAVSNPWTSGGLGAGIVSGNRNTDLWEEGNLAIQAQSKMLYADLNAASINTGMQLLGDPRANSYLNNTMMDPVGLDSAARLLNITEPSPTEIRPGIGTALLMMGNKSDIISSQAGGIRAGKTRLYIDIFQLQNETALDYLTARTATDVNFSAHVTLATPSDSDDDNNTNLAILGGNLTTAGRLQSMKHALVRRGSNHYDAHERIATKFANDRSHLKLMVDETFREDSENFTDDDLIGGVSILGSMNLTEPVGRDFELSGSNFELVSIARFRTEHEINKTIEDIEDEYNGDPGLSKLAETKRSAMEMENILYTQRRKIAKSDFTGYSADRDEVRDNFNNLRTAADKDIDSGKETTDMRGVYEHLDSALSYLSDYTYGVDSANNKFKKSVNESARMIMMLDQTLLLQGTSLLRDREGGAFTSEFGLYDQNMQRYLKDNDLAQRYARLQEKTLNSLIEGRLTVAVDIRNFAEQVLNPLISKMNSAPDSKVNQEYNGNLLGYMRMIKQKYASTSTYAEDILTSIMEGGVSHRAGFEVYEHIFGQGSIAKYEETGLNSTQHVRDTLRTLLAISSGNVQEASVPRQHAKAYSLYEYDNNNNIVTIASNIGSSNFTPFSMELLTESDFNSHEAYMEYKQKLSLELNEVSLNPDYASRFNPANAGYNVLGNRDMLPEVAKVHSQSLHNLVSRGFSEALGWGQEQRDRFFQEESVPRSFMGAIDQPQNMKGDILKQIRNTESVKTAFNILIEQLKRSSVTDIELFNRVSEALGHRATMEDRLAEYEKAFHEYGKYGSEGYSPAVNPYNMKVNKDRTSYTFNNLGGVELSLNSSLESGGTDSFSVKIGNKNLSYTILNSSTEARSNATENTNLEGTIVLTNESRVYRGSVIASKDAGNFATPFGAVKSGMGNELYLNSAQTGVMAILGNVLEYNYRKSIASPAQYINNVNSMDDISERSRFIRDLTVNFLSNLGMGSSSPIERGKLENRLEATLGFHKNLIGADDTPIKGKVLDNGLAGAYGKPVEVTSHKSYLSEDAGTNYNSSGGDNAVNRFVEYLQDPRFSKVISNVRKLDENTKGDVNSKIDVIYDYQGKTYGVQVKSSKTGSEMHLIKNREEIVDTNIDSRNPGVFWVHKNFKDHDAALDMIADFIDPSKKAQDAVEIKNQDVKKFLLEARNTLILLTEYGGKMTQALDNSALPSRVNEDRYVDEYARKWVEKGYYKTFEEARTNVISVRERLRASRNPHMTDLYDVVKNTVELTRGLNANYGSTRRESLDSIIELFNLTIDQFNPKTVGGSVNLDTFSNTLGKILGLNTNEERAKGHVLSDVFALMAHGLSDRVDVNEMINQHVSINTIPFAELGLGTNSQAHYTISRSEYNDANKSFLERSRGSAEVGISNLYSMSSVLSPMIFDPTKYGGTGFYALASAITNTTMEYYSTATGSRMQELSLLNNWEALEAIGIGYIIDGDRDSNDVSQFTESDYYSDIAGVANLGNEFLESQKNLAINSYNSVVASNQTALVNKDRLLITRTGKKDKQFQFAQRIRNAMGTKSKVALSAEYTHYINLLNSFDAKDRSRADNYIENIRKNFRTELFGDDGRTSEREATAALLFGGYFPHMMTMGYQFDSDIRSLMAPSQLKIYENMKAKLNGDEYRDLFDDKQKKHLLRAWAVTRDQLDGTSMTGAPIITDRDGYRWEDQPIMLLRLGGYLHDATYYANAGFGRKINTDSGEEVVPTRYGNINIQNRKVKSYGLMNDFSMANLNLGIGDIVSIDPHTGEAYLVRKGSNIVNTLSAQQVRGIVDNAASAVAASTDQNRNSSSIGSDKLIKLLEGIKDKAVSGSSSITEATLGARVSISYHNNSIEIKTGLGTSGDSSNSATVVRNVSIRSSLLVSGDRQEANFGLFKSVVQMFDVEGFEYRASEYNRSQREGRLGKSRDGFGILRSAVEGSRGIQAHQIHGIANITSFKAYMPGHGAQLLRHEEGVAELTEGISALGAKRVAAAMLLTFGIESFTGYGEDNDKDRSEEYAKKISEALHRYGENITDINGEIDDAPEILRNIRVASRQDSESFLRGGINKLNRLNITSNPLFEVFNQARGGIDLAAVLAGDNGAQTKFIETLNKIIISSAKTGENDRALSTGSMQDMFAESFVAGLHVGMQLVSSQQQFDNMPVNYENYAFEMAAVSLGLTSSQIYEIVNDTDTTRKNNLASMFYGLDMSMRTVALFLGHSPSASKVAVGSRSSGEIEFQIQQKSLLGASEFIKQAHNRKQAANRFFAALKNSFSGRGQIFEENVGTLFDVVGLVDSTVAGSAVTGIDTYLYNNGSRLIGSYYLHALNAADNELSDQWNRNGRNPSDRPTVEQQQTRADELFKEAKTGMQLLGRAMAFFDMDNSRASVNDKARDMMADNKFINLYNQLETFANNNSNNFLDISLKVGRQTNRIGPDGRFIREDITLREFLETISAVNPVNAQGPHSTGYSREAIYKILKTYHKTALRSMFRETEDRGIKSGLYIIDHAEKFIEQGLKNSGNTRDMLLELPAILETSRGTGGTGYIAVDYNQTVRGVLLGSDTLVSLGMHKLGDTTAEMISNQIELHTMLSPDSDVMTFYRSLAERKRNGETGIITDISIDKRMIERLQRFQDLLRGSINSLQEQGQIAASNRITLNLERQTRVVTSNPWLAEGIAVTGQSSLELQKRKKIEVSGGRRTELAEYGSSSQALVRGIDTYLNSFNEILRDVEAGASSNIMMSGANGVYGNGPRDELRNIIGELTTLKNDIKSRNSSKININSHMYNLLNQGTITRTQLNNITDDPDDLAEWEIRLGNLESRARINSLSSLIYRPQPLGGLNISYLHHQIIDIHTYNKAAINLATRGINVSPEIKRQFMKMNEDRSKGLLMVNTVGRMIQNLGDYDGDMVIMIESNIVNLQTNLSQLNIAIDSLNELRKQGRTTQNGKNIDMTVAKLEKEKIVLSSQIANLQKQYSTNYHLKKTRQFIADLVGLDYESIGTGYDSYHYQKLRNQYIAEYRKLSTNKTAVIGKTELEIRNEAAAGVTAGINGRDFVFAGYTGTVASSQDNSYTAFMNEVNRRVEQELTGIKVGDRADEISNKKYRILWNITSKKIEEELIEEGIKRGQMDSRFIGPSLASMLSMHDKGYTLSESRNAWAKFNVEESYNSIYDILYNRQMLDQEKREKFRNLIHLEGSADVTQELSHMQLLAQRFYNQLEPQVGHQEAERRAAAGVLSEFYQHLWSSKNKGEVLEGVQKLFNNLNVGAATTTNILEGSLQIQAELASNILGKAVNFFSLTLYGHMSTGIMSEAVHNNYEDLIEIKKEQIMAKKPLMNEETARGEAQVEVDNLKRTVDKENRRFESIQGMHQTIAQSLRDFIKPTGNIDEISKELSSIQEERNYEKRKNRIKELAGKIGPSKSLQDNFMILEQFRTIAELIHGGTSGEVIDTSTNEIDNNFKVFLEGSHAEGGLNIKNGKALINALTPGDTSNASINKMLAYVASTRLHTLIANTRAETHLKDRSNDQHGDLVAREKDEELHKFYKVEKGRLDLKSRRRNSELYNIENSNLQDYLRQHWYDDEDAGNSNAEANQKRRENLETIILSQSEFKRHVEDLETNNRKADAEYLRKERDRLTILTEIYRKSRKDVDNFIGREGEKLLDNSEISLASSLYAAKDLSDPVYAHTAPFLGAWISKAAHGKEGIGTNEVYRSLSMSLFNMIKDVQWERTVRHDDGSTSKELVTGHVTEDNSKEDIKAYSETVKKQMLRTYLSTMSKSIAGKSEYKAFENLIDLLTAEGNKALRTEGNAEAIKAGLDTTAFGNIIKHINNVFDVYIDSIKRRNPRNPNRDVAVHSTIGEFDFNGDLSERDVERLYNEYFARKEYDINRVRSIEHQKRFNGEIVSIHQASMHIESTGQIYDSLIYPLLVGLGGALANSNQNSNNGINEAAGAFFSNMVFQLESHRAAQLVELGKTRTTLKTLGSMGMAIMGGSMISIRNEMYHHPDESYGQAFIHAYEDRFRMMMWGAVVSATMQGHQGMSEDLSRLTTKLNRRLGEDNVFSRVTQSASEFLEEGLSGVMMNHLNIGPEIDMPGYVKARSLFGIITSIAVGVALQVSGAQKAAYALAGITEDAELNNYVVTQAYKDAAEIKAAAQQSALQVANVDIELIRSEASDIAVGILSGPTGNGEFNSMYSEQQMENLNITIYNENNNADGPQGLIAPDTGLQYST